MSLRRRTWAKVILPRPLDKEKNLKKPGKKKLGKKLSLNRETIRSLDPARLAGAVGGWTNTSYGPGCGITGGDNCGASQGNNCNCTMDESSCVRCVDTFSCI